MKDASGTGTAPFDRAGCTFGVCAVSHRDWLVQATAVSAFGGCNSVVLYMGFEKLRSAHKKVNMSTIRAH